VRLHLASREMLAIEPRASRRTGLASLRLCALALILACAWPSASVGVPAPKIALRVIGDAEQGGVNLLSAAVETSASATCELHVSAGAYVRVFHSRQSGSVSWNWTAPIDAPRGVWTFLATCRAGRAWARWHEHFEMGFPELGRALLASPAGAQSCDGQGVCFAQDPFEVGQCGWYAEGRRPDLRGIVGIVHDDSGAWLGEAAGKVPEGNVPAVGALAVWAPNIPGFSGALGHVAYVAAVSGSRIFVYDSNWRPTPWSPELQVHEHWDPASSVTGYIYGGPAGDGV
jgi:surface antigen